MHQTAEQRRAKRAKNRALGLCANNAKHGPAKTQGLCTPCAAAANAATRRAYYDRKERGVCRASPSHGPATEGSWGGVCGELQRKRHRKRQIAKKRRPQTCALGASHRPAVEGAWCNRCAERQAAAAKRIAARKTGEARLLLPPPPQPAPPTTAPQMLPKQ